MSANNAIFLDDRTNEVYYQPCMDNGQVGLQLIGKGESLKDAVRIAKEYMKELDGIVEYGILIGEVGEQK
jgi:hypothetical protein